MDFKYDFIIAGGGTAGCPLAAELARKGRTLLLERGPPAVRDSTIRTCCNKDEVTWHRTESGSWAATANVLGGGSSINAGVFIRERPDSPFFSAHPFLDAVKVDQAYAHVGAAVSHERCVPSKYRNDMVAAMKETRLGKEAIHTNTGHYGIYHPYSLFGKDGVRHSAADLLPHEGDVAYSNLTVRTNIRVTRIMFDSQGDGPRAIGFEYEDLSQSNPTTELYIQPHGQFYISCGAIHTPRLLQLSGVGDAAHLSYLGIPVVLHQPHVGRHLKDKPVIGISLSSRQSLATTVLDTVASTPDFTIGTASGGSLASYIGPSILAMIPKASRTSTVQWTAAWLLSLLPRRILDMVNQQITMYAMISNPTSEGTLALSSASAQAEPVIRPAGYQTSAEVEAAARALDAVHGLVHSVSLSKYVRRISDLNSTLFSAAQQLVPFNLLSYYVRPEKSMRDYPLTFPSLPNTDVLDPDNKGRLQSWLNNMHAEGWTYTGTCRFDDVVDHDFSVKGIKGLSIVDASVLKRPTRVNQQATMMMLGVYAGSMA